MPSAATDSSGTTLYSWNARNQLVGISGPNVNASFVYDGIGRREKKTINGSLIEFLYDGVNPVQESAGALILANILPGLGVDEFLTRTDVIAGTTSNFLSGALGSPVAVADTAGAVQTEYTYESFGKTTSTGLLNSSTYQYTGRENDETGLYFYRARYYSPSLQRFISEDPIEFGGGDINLYGYVGNRPTSATDPSGLVPVALPLICLVNPALCAGVGAVTIGVIIHYINNPIQMSLPRDPDDPYTDLENRRRIREGKAELCRLAPNNATSSEECVYICTITKRIVRLNKVKQMDLCADDECPKTQVLPIPL